MNLSWPLFCTGGLSLVATFSSSPAGPPLIPNPGKTKKVADRKDAPPYAKEIKTLDQNISKGILKLFFHSSLSPLYESAAAGGTGDTLRLSSAQTS
jgi:hypothetical protein